jgi:3-oxoacyl-[acyl-carrier-protein] synthase-3
MGTTIEHVQVSAGRWRYRRSALGLADAAARQCLDAAGVEHRDVDLLVNAGLYRDRNLGEPAFAALIQDDVGLNSEDPHPGGHGTFSFDVANGTCGALTSLQIVDGFLRAGTIRRALVVASDADPGHHLAPSFPFSPAGAAALCAWRDDDRGLGPMRWLTAPDGGESFRAVVRHEGGANRLRFDIDAAYLTEAAVLAAKAAAQVLAASGVSTLDLDAVVVAPGHDSFVATFLDILGVGSDCVVASADPTEHTASFLVALATASTGGRLAAGSTALFACAGAGITAGACLYRG